MIFRVSPGLSPSLIFCSLIYLPVSLALPASAESPAATTQPALPTGRSIQPPLKSTSQGVGSMPMNVIISPDGNFAITTGAGFKEELCSIRVSDGTKVSSIDFPKTSTDHANGLYYGLAFGPDGRLYAAQGAAQKVAILELSKDGKLKRTGSLAMGPHDFAAGVAVDEKGHVYVTQNAPTPDSSSDDAASFGTPGSVSIHDSSTGKEIGRYVFHDDLGLSNFPLAVAVNHDGSRLYVGSQRDDAVYVLDASDPSAIKLVSTLSTGSHPVALLLNSDQSILYVANAQSDTISIVDTHSEKITGTVLIRPEVAKGLAGATPTGLALSKDEKTLYATLGDMNAVAVIDVGDQDGPSVLGYLPVGWYPTAIAVAGDQLFVTNAKGDLSRVPHDFSSGRRITSPLLLFEGTLWRLAVPEKKELDALTQKSLENSRLTPKYLDGKNPLAAISRKSGNIQHVIYIIKENRTYDQILGDLPQGNGDPQRCLFGRDVTPNQHMLAEHFVLLDNFYDSGEVSGDGWTWSTQAQANEYTIRNVPYQYSERGRTFDYEGANNDYPTGGFPATGPDGKPMSADPRFKQGGKSVPDVAAAPGGHLWDMARKTGISYRNYGFFLTDQVQEGGKVIIPGNYPTVAGLQPGGRDLAGITDVDFRRFDLDYPDSEAPSQYATNTGDAAFQWRKTSYGAANMPSRYSEWKREFDLMLAKDPSGKSVPNLMTVRFCTDHTSGAKARHATPTCMVADNDFAVGQLVEAISHSPIWKSSAIVIVEDDAQNGPDHVDAHRSTCCVVSPWIRKGAIDHSFQNTVSAIRTIECLLDLPPMCQYDAASPVIDDWNSAPNNDEPLTAILPSAEIMKQRNPAFSRDVLPASPEAPHGNEPTTKPAPASSPHALLQPLKSREDLAAVSQAMDFTDEDQVPADLLNSVIWKTVRGPESEVPPTPHAIAPANQKPAVDKDDD
jgi:DNA-binding beta-propeller fold protein YncE